MTITKTQEKELEKRINILKFELDKLDDEVQKIYLTKCKLQDNLAMIRLIKER